MNTIRLFTYFRSGAAHRARIALALKEIAYESVPVHLLRGGGEHLQPAFRAINPQARVPVLSTALIRAGAEAPHLSTKGTLMPALFRPAALGRSIILLGATNAAPALAQSLAAPVQSTRDVAQEERNRQIVIEFYDGVFNRHDVARSAEILADRYIQHNPGVPDGRAPFVNYFTGFFNENPNARSRIVRSAADGDLVYLHVHSTNGEADRGRAIVDIFRIENNRIVEHWDVIQNVPETAANRNTMF